MFDDCIILAGGSGTRLWPASNSKLPKQFLPISKAGEHTFFDAALERALAVIDRTNGQVIIIAGETHVPHIIKMCAKLSDEERKCIVLIPEPGAKNTAAAIACGVIYIDRISKVKRNILVLTSDHIITPLEVFKADAAAAAVFAGQDKLVVFGISPLSPETGYGYIETGETLSVDAGYSSEAYKPSIFKVVAFREKPERVQAEQFIAAGGFYWNSGMFAFSSQGMLNELRQHAVEVIGPFENLQTLDARYYRVENGLRILEEWPGLPEAYEKTKSISFDYALAEKCASTIMVAGGFDWYDVGSWDIYAQLVGETRAEIYQTGSASCFVDSDIPVALCGVQDLIVVIRSGKDGSEPSVLIAKKGETQGVKHIVEELRATGKTHLL